MHGCLHIYKLYLFYFDFEYQLNFLLKMHIFYVDVMAGGRFYYFGFLNNVPLNVTVL